MIPPEEVTRKTFNRLKPYYDLSWDPVNQTLHVGLFLKRTDDLYKAYEQATSFLITKAQALKPLGSTSRVLDLGCGNGKTLLDICARFGAKGLGIDISDEQIKQARANLAAANRMRKKEGLPALKCSFIRGSVGKLKKLVGRRTFTHVISQDALLLVNNKKKVFADVSRVLVEGGVLAIADFLRHEPVKKFSKTQRKQVLEYVNWREGFSFEEYQQVLINNGFNIIEAQKRNADMVRTYSLLVKQLNKFARKDKVYLELQERYRGVVKAVRAGKMGWALFLATKK